MIEALCALATAPFILFLTFLIVAAIAVAAYLER